MSDTFKTSVGKDSRRVLVFRVGHLGDSIIALPALRAIRKNFPRAKITLLSNFYSDAERVSPSHIVPAKGVIDEWLTYPSNSTGDGASNKARLLMKLRRGRFDILVYLAPRIRCAEDRRRDLLFFRLAGIRRVIGEQGFDPLPRPGPEEALPLIEHEADHLLRRLALSGLAVPRRGEATIDLDLTEAEQKQADEWLHDKLPIGVSPFVGFGPGSKWPSKVWPEERFLEVGLRLIQERDIFPVVFGGPEDRLLGDRLIRTWGRGANAAGELNVRQAGGALARCGFYVGNDTGTMHLAAAVRTPCVAIMSAIDWPGRWNPYGQGHIVLRRQVPCEGCLLEVCVAEGMRCLKEIEVNEVLSACRQLLARIEDCVPNIVIEEHGEKMSALAHCE